MSIYDKIFFHKKFQGYVFICRNAEGVHGKTKVGNLCVRVSRWGKMWPKPFGLHYSCHILGNIVFLPNFMPLLSCHLPCPKGLLSGSIFLSRFSCWSNILS